MDYFRKITDGIGATVDFLLKERSRQENFILALIIVVLAFTANYAVIIGVDYFKMPQEIAMDEKGANKVFNDVAYQVNTLNASDGGNDNFEFAYLNIPECEYIFSCDSKGIIMDCVPALQYLKGLRVYPPQITGTSTMLHVRSLVAKNNAVTNVYEIWLKKDDKYLCVAVNTSLIYRLENMYDIDIYLEGVDEDDIAEHYVYGQYSIATNLSKKKIVFRYEEKKKMSETMFIFAKEDEIFKDILNDIIGYIALLGIIFLVLTANSDNKKQRTKEEKKEGSSNETNS